MQSRCTQLTLKISLIIVFLGIACLPAYAESLQSVNQKQLETLTGKKLSADPKDRWDQVYNQPTYIYGKSAASFLVENYQYIPYQSSVLDLGMGEGRNAIFLAQKGYQVTGIDLSSVAVKKAKSLAQERGVKLKTVVASALEYDFAEKSFDAIICFYFVDRNLIKKMKKWLKPQGIIIFEAYSLEQKKTQKNALEQDSDYLQEGELLQLFSDFRILKFEEPLHKNQFTSSIIVQKKN